MERETRRTLALGERRLTALATQARLVDPARLLARGYTITTGADGRILTRAAEAAPLPRWLPPAREPFRRRDRGVEEDRLGHELVDDAEGERLLGAFVLAGENDVERGAHTCLLYTSDAADERSSVDLGGRRIIKKKITEHERRVVITKTMTKVIQRKREL